MRRHRASQHQPAVRQHRGRHVTGLGWWRREAVRRTNGGSCAEYQKNRRELSRGGAARSQSRRVPGDFRARSSTVKRAPQLRTIFAAEAAGRLRSTARRPQIMTLCTPPNGPTVHQQSKSQRCPSSNLGASMSSAGLRRGFDSRQRQHVSRSTSSVARRARRPGCRVPSATMPVEGSQRRRRSAGQQPSGGRRSAGGRDSMPGRPSPRANRKQQTAQRRQFEISRRSAPSPPGPQQSPRSTNGGRPKDSARRA